jgi:hypothetical protein
MNPRYDRLENFMIQVSREEPQDCSGFARLKLHGGR